MEDPFFHFSSPLQIVIVAASAISYHQLQKRYPSREEIDIGYRIVRKLLPLTSVLLSAQSDTIHSVFSYYDVHGTWMARNDVIWLAITIYRADSVFSLIERVERQLQEELTPLALWGITRRAALVYLWFGACGALCNLALPALVLDDFVAFILNDTDIVMKTSFFSNIPDVVVALLDWLPFLPIYVKYIQVAGLCFRHGGVFSGLCGVICVLHNIHALYSSMFIDFYATVKRSWNRKHFSSAQRPQSA